MVVVVVKKLLFKKKKKKKKTHTHTIHCLAYRNKTAEDGTPFLAPSPPPPPPSPSSTYLSPKRLLNSARTQGKRGGGGVEAHTPKKTTRTQSYRY